MENKNVKKVEKVKKTSALEKHDNIKRMALKYGESENLTFKKDFQCAGKKKITLEDYRKKLRNLGISCTF